IADELRATDATVEVTYANGLRHVSALEPAAVAAAARALGPGTVVAIAGGTRGLGAKLAAALADRGCKGAVLGRTPPAAAAATFHRCDVTDAAQVAAALADARRAHGPIEVLVHAAGVLADGPVERKTDADFARVFDTKVAGARALWDA